MTLEEHASVVESVLSKLSGNFDSALEFEKKRATTTDDQEEGRIWLAEYKKRFKC